MRNNASQKMFSKGKRDVLIHISILGVNTGADFLGGGAGGCAPNIYQHPPKNIEIGIDFKHLLFGKHVSLL